MLGVRRDGSMAILVCDGRKSGISDGLTLAEGAQRLLNEGLATSGIVAAETFDYDIIDKIYDPFDSMTMLVSLLPDGSMKKEIVASIARGIRANKAYEKDMWELKKAFRNPSLQMVSFTITEKGAYMTAVATNDIDDIFSLFRR